MVAQGGSPTALKWWIASELRRLREGRGISREEAAGAIMSSVGTIAHFETARSLPKPLELDTLVTFYGVPQRAALFQDLRARAKRGRDWWVGLSTVVPGEWNLFLGLECSAARIESWDAVVVPGLFQTRARAEALIRASRPDLGTAAVAQLVELRIGRQRAVLDREEPPLVWSVIAESALRWAVGGQKAQREQLEHLIALTERPNVDIQVLRSSDEGHVGIDGTFTVVSAPPELLGYPGCVHIEDRLQGHFYEEPEQVTRYRDDLTRLRVQATAPGETAAYLRQVVKDL